jgi:hypothetical protein
LFFDLHEIFSGQGWVFVGLARAGGLAPDNDL